MGNLCRSQRSKKGLEDEDYEDEGGFTKLESGTYYENIQ